MVNVEWIVFDLFRKTTESYLLYKVHNFKKNLTCTDLKYTTIKWIKKLIMHRKALGREHGK